MNRNHVFFSNVWKFQDFEYFYRFHVVNRNDKKCHCMFWTGTLARILRATQIGDLMGPSWALVACQFVEKICIHSQREKLSSAFRESTEKINLIFAHMCTRVSLQLLWFIGISFFLHFSSWTSPTCDVLSLAHRGIERRLCLKPINYPTTLGGSM